MTISYCDSAIVTITAADPDGLQANQGFNVTVGQSGIKQATVAIFGLRDVEDRSKSINPTNVSGNISVILDVQPNDETVTAIALTLGDETVQCRGTSADASSPVAGLAESGGQIEVDCFLDTDAVNGACMGMQLDPTYANGDYALGAFVTTDEGHTRSVVATQPITLKNSGFVIISHEAGAMSVVSETTKGLTFYGGPSTAEGNLNQFHACPVSYGGTTVGELQLGTVLTDTERPNPNPVDGAKITFRNPAGGPLYPIDDEAPFTWSVSTAHSRTGNSAVENVPGETEHWVEVIGLIKNGDGLDVTGQFATRPAGPYHFDFRAPRINDPAASAIVVSANYGDGLGRSSRPIADGNYFSDGSSRTPARLVVSNVVEMGVGGVDETIAVGDCSIAANTDGASRGTAFVAAFDDVRNISELPEDDSRGDLSDDGGLDCYVAELQALQDVIGNSTWLGGSTPRVQSGGEFGVDRTPLEVSRLRPDETLVLATDMLTFEAEDPPLETGEAGSGFSRLGAQRFYSGDWRSTNANVTASNVEEDVTLNVSALDDGSHAVRGLVGDGALPTNWNVGVFQFVRDTKAPTFTAGSGPGAVSAGSSGSVTVTVSGSIRDANVIDEALLKVFANNGSTAVCAGEDTADMPLHSSRVGTKDIENDSKRIDFEESVTIKRPAAGGGTEELCFVIEVKDVAVDATGDDDAANKAQYAAGNFSINWGVGMTVAAEVGGANTLDAMGVLRVSEDGTAVTVDGTDYAQTGTFTLVLDAEPASAVTVTVTGHGDNATTTDSTFTFLTAAEVSAGTITDDGAATAGLWSTAQTVTVNGVEDDRGSAGPPAVASSEDAMDNAVTLMLTAAGGGYSGTTGSVPVTVLDNDATLTVGAHDITAGGATPVTVTVTATLANPAPSGGASFTVVTDDSDANGSTSTPSGGGSISIDAGETVGTVEVSVDPSSGAGAGTITVSETGGNGTTATITIKASSE